MLGLGTVGDTAWRHSVAHTESCWCIVTSLMLSALMLPLTDLIGVPLGRVPFICQAVCILTWCVLAGA